MIIAGILLGIAVIPGLVGIVKAFWNDILNFMKRVIQKVQQVVNGIVYGAKILIQKTREGIREISRTYRKVDGHWEQTTTTKIVSEDEVPADIRARAAYSEETDITNQMEMILENAS